MPPSKFVVNIIFPVLQGLWKLGALGGRDASIQSMAEGFTVILTKVCRRLLLGHKLPATSEKPGEKRTP